MLLYCIAFLVAFAYPLCVNTVLVWESCLTEAAALSSGVSGGWRKVETRQLVGVHSVQFLQCTNCGWLSDGKGILLITPHMTLLPKDYLPGSGGREPREPANSAFCCMAITL